MYCCIVFFFFFKQKTAYEMRISDWSSDVCSSDLSLEELEDEGVEILTSADGEEAVASIEQERPDLVILDVMMPKINGFDVCQRVKIGRASCRERVWQYV